MDKKINLWVGIDDSVPVKYVRIKGEVPWFLPPFEADEENPIIKAIRFAQVCFNGREMNWTSDAYDSFGIGNYGDGGVSMTEEQANKFVGLLVSLGVPENMIDVEIVEEKKPTLIKEFVSYPETPTTDKFIDENNIIENFTLLTVDGFEVVTRGKMGNVISCHRKRLEQLHNVIDRILQDMEAED